MARYDTILKKKCPKWHTLYMVLFFLKKLHRLAITINLKTANEVSFLCLYLLACFIAIKSVSYTTILLTSQILSMSHYRSFF